MRKEEQRGPTERASERPLNYHLLLLPFCAVESQKAKCVPLHFLFSGAYLCDMYIYLILHYYGSIGMHASAPCAPLSPPSMKLSLFSPPHEIFNLSLCVYLIHACMQPRPRPRIHPPTDQPVLDCLE